MRYKLLENELIIITEMSAIYIKTRTNVHVFHYNENISQKPKLKAQAYFGLNSFLNKKQNNDDNFFRELFQILQVYKEAFSERFMNLEDNRKHVCGIVVQFAEKKVA